MENKNLKLLLFFLFITNSFYAQIINEFSAANNSFKNIKGKAYDWIEIYNNSNKDLELKEYSLSDDANNPRKWIFPAFNIKANSYIIVWASGKGIALPNGELQTNFKIKSKGEALYLFSPTGKMLDHTPSTKLNPNTSLGRTPIDLKKWYFFSEPTPGRQNNSDAYKNYVDDPKFLTKAGFYKDSAIVKIIRKNPHDKIFYTLDSSIPTENSKLYTKAIVVKMNSVIRIKAFRIWAVPSNTITNTYFVDETFNLGVVSLVTENDNFFGKMGIYKMPHRKIERPVHIEYFTKEKEIAFSQDIGVKIHAPDGRRQKSLRLYARDKYGKSKIKYKIFKDKDISSFKRLVLRNGGNDGLEKGKTQVRDIFTHKLYQLQDHENAIASFEIVNVFINGKYWGIYNLRERQDEHYIKYNFGFSEEEVDFLEYDYKEPGYKKTISGDWKDWKKLRKFLETSDMKVEDNYYKICDWIDVNNFIDYQIFEIFIGNQDWENNNIKFWKPKKEGGKWKWVLWDTDYALGEQKKFPVGKPSHNFIHMALTYGGWGDGDYTWMLRNLMKNKQFRELFIIRYLDLLNTTFVPSFTTEIFNSLGDTLETDISKQFEKWGKSKEIWKADMLYTNDFLRNRPEFSRKNLANEFELNDTLKGIKLEVSDNDAGRIKLNTLFIDGNTLGWLDKSKIWKGEYFKNSEISVVAMPNSGLFFDHWEGDVEDDMKLKDTLIFKIESTIYLKAIFKKNPVIVPKLYINEVMALNKNAFENEDGDYSDWIEIYNPTDEAINISGFYLTDDLSNPDKYKIPIGMGDKATVLPKSYLLIIADDKNDEMDLHTGFKLSKNGEAVGLYMKNGDDFIVIDTISFPKIGENISYGRLPDGGKDWHMFEISTPNAKNEIIFPDNIAKINFENIQVYPNPSSGLFNMKYNGYNLNGVKCSVYNISGKRVFQGKLNDMKIDLSEEKSGIYIIQIAEIKGGIQYVKKIIKN